MIQLALAALRNANEVHGIVDFESYLHNILVRQSSEHTVSELLSILDSVNSWVEKYKFPTEKDMKHINRKLKSCWGHGSHDDSKKREKKSKHKSHRSSHDSRHAPAPA
ncbi:CYCH1-1 [Linum grandiflorum]